ncbi:MAG TPA: hypothetical protein VGT03_04910 [Candidatus Acidoferrales bacterium]|nr:hypothetical protein [Candidatus Acidoferrales bacterium]
MNPASGNPVQMIEGATASGGLLATNLRLVLLSAFVLIAVFVQRQIMRIMALAQRLNY